MFRSILQSLRDGVLTVSQWEKLTERVTFNVSHSEITLFNDALRIFLKRSNVAAYNYSQLRV